MKKYLLLPLWIIFLFPSFSSGQGNDTLAPARNPAPAPAVQQQEREPNRINSGFYIMLGPNFPVGNYAAGQKLSDKNPTDHPIYFPAKMGAAMDMGFLIYLGPAFANNHLRAGIDATFLSFSFNPVKADTISSPKTKYWYYFGGQKFGPVFSICPVDRLVINLSYKMNAYVAYVHHIVRGKYNDEWGSNLFQNEVSMSLRYSIMLFAFQYNFGKCTYNDFDGTRPDHKVDNSTFRFLVGLKF
jgi:hypothetical protein